MHFMIGIKNISAENVCGCVPEELINKSASVEVMVGGPLGNKP